MDSNTELAGKHEAVAQIIARAMAEKHAIFEPETPTEWDEDGNVTQLCWQQFINDAHEAIELVLPHINALTQPAEQIADGVLGVTQADLNAAADLIEQYWSGADDSMMKLAKSTRAGHRQGAFPRAFAVRAQQARAQALEEAAKVAEDHGEQYHEPTQSDYDRRDGAYAAAQAIRALNGQGGGV